MNSYELLYNALVHDLHHKIGAHFATVEGLFYLAIKPGHQDYEHFKKVFEQLRADKREITERYYRLEELIKSTDADNA